MKWLFLLALFLLIPTVQCTILDHNIEVYLQDDGTSDWVVSVVYDEVIEKTDYYVLARIVSATVTVDDKPIECSISERELGTSIICENISSNRVDYQLKTGGVVSIDEDLRLFSYRFPITQQTNNYSVTVKLPLGAFLVDRSKLQGTGLLPYEPGFGQQGSDGRRIFVIWELSNPKVGDSLNTSVIYEQVIASNLLIAIGFVFIILVIAGVFFFFRKRGMKEILPVLNEGERKVMEILLRDKEADQKKIVKECDFSKSKISRIIHDLEKRGLITRVPKGRKNIITLKKKGKEEK